MSLLLEALKKAEKAKEEAQRRARGESVDTASQPEAKVEPERKPVLTRDKLPDISPTLEIVSDYVAPGAGAGAASEMSARPSSPATPSPSVQPGPAPRPATGPADPAAAGRASAKKVFEAKFREPNPRMPFYITVAALGVFAVGTVGYFWYQLRPPAPLVNANPARNTDVTATQENRATPVVAVAPMAATPAIPGLPVAPTKGAAAAPNVGATQTAAPASPSAPLRADAEVIEVPRLAPRLVPRQAIATTPAPQAHASVSRPAPQVHPKVAAGYSAYLGGDLSRAREEYQDALRDEPANRDALLGLAAVDVRAGRYEAAEGMYLRVLQADPRDAQAQAALIALRSGRSDPLATESRVKSMLAADPDAHALNFALGNQFAQQNRWAEAQQEYFKAYAAEPENADFAYNVAVALDHLRQPRLALDYYQRAIALAEKRAASFDVAAAKTRAAQLAR